MKILIASDIHGSAYYCEKLLNAFDKEMPNKMLLLGDILYHGPRNDLPKGYDPKTVIKMLNERKADILCVRGNCDTEVDQMVLDFPVMADYCIVYAGNTAVYATHGHVYNENNLPPLQKGDVLLHGHTHVPVCREHEDYTYVNPGSVSIPKEGSEHGYAVLTENGVEWKTLDGRTFMNYVFKITLENK